MDNNVKKYIPHILSVVIIVASSIFYFLPQFSGKVIRQGDMIQNLGMSKELRDYYGKTGKTVLWTNSMFGGMPTYTIAMPGASGSKIGYVQKLTSLGIDAPTGWFISGMLMFYITLLLLGINPWVSLIGSLFFGFTSNNIILYEAGHVSKVLALFASAPIIGGIILTYRQKFLVGGLLFAMGLALNIAGNHVQMSYYLGLTLIALVIGYFIHAIMHKQIPSFFKSSAILVLGTLLAVGSSATRLWTFYEYSKETMRGKPILTSTDKTKPTKGDGLEYDYAMQWSNGTIDLLAGVIPKIAGGGSGEFVKGDTPLAKAVGSRRGMAAPAYHGELPFTSGPVYFGIIAFMLFLFGLFIVDNKIKWWLLGAVIITSALSLGKNLIGNEAIYNLLPMYSKFRTPNSIGSVTAIFFPILAAMALSQILKDGDRKKYIKPLLYTIGILGGIALMTAVMGGIFIDYNHAEDEQYKQFIDPLIATRESLTSGSAWRSLFLVLLCGGVIYFYLKEKLNAGVMLAIIGAVGVFDLMDIDNDYLGYKDFVNKSTMSKPFEERDVDRQIAQDKDLSYRVYDATINTFNSASTSYFHKTVGGYSPAKLQRIQDVIERHITQGNQKVLDMLNTRYYITNGQDQKPIVNRNPAALGNAWFVSNIALVDNANQEIDSLKGFNPRREAIVHKEFADYVKDLGGADSSNILTLKSYNPNTLVYESNSSKDALAVFSEVWYGPNLGWQAYIDNKPVDHIRANYLLRALKIPSGKHEIKFDFSPKSFYTGEKISMISSIILILAMLAAIVWSFFIKPKNI